MLHPRRELRSTAHKAMSKQRTHIVRAARSRYAIGLALTVALAIASGSRLHLAATGGNTVYGQAYAQDTAFSGTLQSGAVDGGVLTSPADARGFAKGQLARVYLDCAALAVLPSTTAGADLCAADPTQTTTPVNVILQD